MHNPDHDVTTSDATRTDATVTTTAGLPPGVHAGVPALVPATAVNADATAGEIVAPYLHARAADFLRGLRLHTESGADTAGSEAAARTDRKSVV